MTWGCRRRFRHDHSQRWYIANTYVYIYIYFDTFTRTPVRVSKMNAVSPAQLKYQMLTFKYIYIYIAMNRKVPCCLLNSYMAIDIYVFKHMDCNI